MLSIENLQADYGRGPVLRDFSLRVEAGQVAAVIGPNGCGKSTMLRCVSGLMRPQSGRVLVAGQDVTTLSGRERARQMALLPQNFTSELWNDLAVEEVVARRTHAVYAAVWHSVAHRLRESSKGITDGGRRAVARAICK
jgi:iron complex transport system ATP-binding protein